MSTQMLSVLLDVLGYAAAVAILMLVVMLVMTSLGLQRKKRP